MAQRPLWQRILLAALVIPFSYLVFLLVPVVEFHDPTSTVLIDREGNLLGATIASDDQWRFPELTKLPDKLVGAITVAEDKRFFSHHGIDAGALARAISQNLRQRRIVSGASTLTMQVVRLSRKNQERNIAEKIIEAILALRLEHAKSKDRILRLYLMHAPFGKNLVGVAAASWRYFGRPPEHLSWGEAAALAVLPNSPSLVHPGRNREKLLHKRNRLLDKLQNAGLLDGASCALAKKEPLPDAPVPFPALAPHLLARAQLSRISKTGPADQNEALATNNGWVQSTLKRDLQIRCAQIVARHAQRLRETGINNAAALVLDVQTGQVLAYIGNVFAANPNAGEYVDIITSQRSTGSVLKPFLYAGMLDSAEILPEQLVADIPTSMNGFSPQNFTHHYAGAVPASRALARSLNVPAVRMLHTFGVDRFYVLLQNLGMTTLNRPASNYGLALILGGAEGSLWDLTAMYAGLARRANFTDQADHTRSRSFFPATYLLPSSPSSPSNSPNQADEPLSKGASWATLQALLEVERPGAEMAWRDYGKARPIAWKTGTSYGFRDGWALGVTPRYAVGVWAGNASGEGRPDLMGFSAAAPIMFDIFDLLQTTDWFTPPIDDLASVDICLYSGMRAGPNCQHTRKALIPKNGLPSRACVYCTLVNVDARATWQVHGNCESVSQIRPTKWFVLPPSMEWYYKRAHAEYRPLPPLRADCRDSQSSGTGALSLIYPENESRIYVPLELDGSRGRAVFQAAHRNSRTIIYWHLDDDYVGQTRDIHQLALAPSPGRHTLTVVDENGESVQKSFTVLSKQ